MIFRLLLSPSVFNVPENEEAMYRRQISITSTTPSLDDTDTIIWHLVVGDYHLGVNI